MSNIIDYRLKSSIFLDLFNQRDYDRIIDEAKNIEFSELTFEDQIIAIDSSRLSSEFDLAREFINKALLLIENSAVRNPSIIHEENIEYIKIKIKLLEMLYYSGQISETNEILTEFGLLYENLSNTDGLTISETVLNVAIDFLNMKGNIDYWQNRYHEAELTYATILNFGQMYVNNEIIVRAKINLGLIKQMNGNFKEAISLYEEVLKVDVPALKQRVKLTVGNNLGSIYSIFGNLSDAKQCLNMAIEAGNSMGETVTTSKAYLNLGIVYFVAGDFDESLLCLDKAYKMKKNIGNSQELALVLHEKTLVLNRLGHRIHAEETYSEMRGCITEESSGLLKELLKFTEAVLLKDSILIRNKGKAEVLLREIIDGPYFKMATKIDSYLILSEMLIDQLFNRNVTIVESEERELFDELHEIYNKIEHFANNQESKIALLHAKILKAHLAIFELDSQSARKILQEVEALSHETGVKIYNLASPQIDDDSELDFNLDILSAHFRKSLNKIIHSIPRLKIMVVLNNSIKLSFAELKELTHLTDGNLGANCDRLVDSNYIVKLKDFEDTRFTTFYQITPEGQAAFREYKSVITPFFDSST